MFVALQSSKRRTMSGIVWTLKHLRVCKNVGHHHLPATQYVEKLNSFETGKRLFSSAETPSLIVDEWIPPLYNPTGYVREIPKKQFGKKQMHAEYIARRMDESSIVIVVRGRSIGKSEHIKLKKLLREAGFRPNHLRAQGLVAAARYYSKYSDPDHIAGAESFGHGQLMLLMYRPPLITLATTDRLQKLSDILPLSSDKKKLEKHKASAFKDFEIVGGYFLDEGKTTRNVWLDKADMSDLLENMRKLADSSLSGEDRETINSTYRTEDSTMDPHSFYISQAANIISSQAGAFVPPLEQALGRLPQTLQQSVDQVGHVFDSIEDAKKQESS
mmetsp:Transcript_12487/g.16190  ORF Transcript_12487/g.16190 Transcript_12487/m.16190 type:complete len:330 (-) Transcript_12487:57-1046(-)